MATENLRRGEAIGALSVAIGLGFGIPVFLPEDAHRNETWPWWAITGEVVAGLFFLLAVWLILQDLLRAAWARSPYQLRSPVTRRNPATPKVQAPPPEFGRVDLEIFIDQASDATVELLGKIAREHNRNARKIERQAALVQKVAGASAERRKRALSRGARVIRGHALNLAKLEAKYRVETQAMITHSKRLIELTPPDEDLGPLIPSTQGVRTATVGSRDSTVSYRAAVQANRATNVSQDMNGAYDQLLAVLDRMIEDTTGVIDYYDWLLEVAAKREPVT